MVRICRPCSRLTAARPAKKARTDDAESFPQDNEPDDVNDQPDEESVAEFAGEEGLSEDEALAEIEEIADDPEEELVDVEEEEGGDA